MSNNEFVLKVTEDDIKIISAGLTELPFKYVNVLINKLQLQINEQSSKGDITNEINSDNNSVVES